MKLRIMTTEAISYVKKNINCLLDYYKNGLRPEKWLKEKLGKDPFVIIDALEFEDFELLVTPDKPSADEAFNIKLLYSKMKALNDSFASDERLWAGLSHTVFYDYLLKRWPGYFKSIDILNHFFFNQSKPRCYFVNTISRLWWFGRKTYSDDFEDNWKIMNYLSRDINGCAFTLFGSNWPNSTRTLNLFMRALIKYEEETKNKVYRELFNDALKYTNCLGGIYIIDACDDSFVIDNIYEFIKIRSEERIKEAEFNKLNNVKTSGVEKFDNLIKAINRIGGIGSLSQINESYSYLVGKNLSNAQKKYIKNALEKNCIDCVEYKGNPIFYKISDGDKKFWKISNSYLIKENYKIRNDFIKKQIDSLDHYENLIFNTINSIRGDKISIDDILLFKQQIILNYPEIDNFDVFLKKYLKKLSVRGLIEKIDNNLYKKSMLIKIK